ncbi:MAG: SMI1/KNR4 family protein [Thermoguttaceae bacterium]|nr:SMI1/KNR4 family protein [Thermoguttaceae bacterium]
MTIRFELGIITKNWLLFASVCYIPPFAFQPIMFSRFFRSLYNRLTFQWKVTPALFPGERQVIDELFSVLENEFPGNNFNLDGKQYRRIALGENRRLSASETKKFNGYVLQIGPPIAFNSELDGSFIAPDMAFTTSDGEEMRFSFGIDSFGLVAFLAFMFDKPSSDYMKLSLWQAADKDSVRQLLVCAVNALASHRFQSDNRNLAQAFADVFSVQFQPTDITRIKSFKPLDGKTIEQFELKEGVFFPEDYKKFLSLTNGLLVFHDDSRTFSGTYTVLNGIPNKTETQGSSYFFDIQNNYLIDPENGEKYWQISDGDYDFGYVKYLMKLSDKPNQTGAVIYVVSMDDCDFNEQNVISLPRLITLLLNNQTPEMK